MSWKVGQKVAALCTLQIVDCDDKWVENVIEFDKVYQVISIESGCCMSLLDVGKTYNSKGGKLIYDCEKCKKVYYFKETEVILFHEKCFRPIDDDETMLAKSVRKISNLFSKKKKVDGYVIRKIKIRIPIPPPFLDPQPRPITVPKREVEVQPEWEEELV